MLALAVREVQGMKEMWRGRGGVAGTEGGAGLSGERGMRRCDKVLWDKRIDTEKREKGKGATIAWHEKRGRLHCCGKGHQPPLWVWVVFELHFCGVCLLSFVCSWIRHIKWDVSGCVLSYTVQRVWFTGTNYRLLLYQVPWEQHFKDTNIQIW